MWINIVCFVLFCFFFWVLLCGASTNDFQRALLSLLSVLSFDEWVSECFRGSVVGFWMLTQKLYSGLIVFWMIVLVGGNHTITIGWEGEGRDELRGSAFKRPAAWCTLSTCFQICSRDMALVWWVALDWTGVIVDFEPGPWREAANLPNSWMDSAALLCVFTVV